MIVNFSISPKELTAIPAENLQIIISCLMNNYRRGRHLIIMGRATGSWLLNQSFLSKFEKSFVNQCVQEFTQTGGLLVVTPFYIDIIKTDILLIERHEKRIIIPSDPSIIEDILNSPMLLIEDIESDGSIIETILNVLLKRMPFRHFHGEYTHGGGSSSFKVARRKVSERRIVVFLSDSDKSSPVDPHGKEKEVRKLSDELNWPLLFPYILPCREIENVIPLDITYLLSGSKVSATFANLNSIQKKEFASGINEKDKFIYWFDMKDGINVFKIDKCQCSLSKVYLTNKINEINRTSIAGFGPRMISNVINDSKLLAKFCESIKSKQWIEVFERFFRNILWVLAAGTPRLT